MPVLQIRLCTQILFAVLVASLAREGLAADEDCTTVECCEVNSYSCYLRCLALPALGESEQCVNAAQTFFNSSKEDPEDRYAQLDGNLWKLVWSDEFSDGIITTDKWTFEVGGGFGEDQQYRNEPFVVGWGNDEEQFYTDGSNAKIENGTLIIEIREESAPNDANPYTSTRMITKNKYERKYGRIEARARLPGTQSLWSAIWLLGANIDDVIWPDAGELDILEMLGDMPNRMYSAVHGPGYSGEDSVLHKYTLENTNFTDDFHDFQLTWYPDSVKFWVDGILVGITSRSDIEQEGNKWVFDHPFYILINVAVGGLWPGYPDESTVMPQRMEVDYVRVYEENGAAPPQGSICPGCINSSSHPSTNLTSCCVYNCTEYLRTFFSMVDECTSSRALTRDLRLAALIRERDFYTGKIQELQEVCYDSPPPPPLPSQPPPSPPLPPPSPSPPSPSRSPPPTQPPPPPSPPSFPSPPLSPIPPPSPSPSPSPFPSPSSPPLTGEEAEACKLDRRRAPNNGSIQVCQMLNDPHLRMFEGGDTLLTCNQTGDFTMLENNYLKISAKAAPIIGDTIDAILGASVIESVRVEYKNPDCGEKMEFLAETGSNTEWKDDASDTSIKVSQFELTTFGGKQQQFLSVTLSTPWTSGTGVCLEGCPAGSSVDTSYDNMRRKLLQSTLQEARDACAEADLSGSRLQSCIWDALASGDRDTAIQASIQGAIDLKEAEAQAVTNNIAFSGASSLTAVSPLIIAMQIFLQFIFRF